jgi:hypothetical protein
MGKNANYCKQLKQQVPFAGQPDAHHVLEPAAECAALEAEHVLQNN